MRISNVFRLFITSASFIALVAHGEPIGCLIEPSVVADVGSEVIGVLEKINVDRGDLVKKGQAVAELDARVEHAAFAAAQARAHASAELLSAESGNDFARRKKERTEDLFKKQFVSEQVNEQAATEARVAEMRLQQAREQQDIAERELALAQAQLARRTIRSPITGEVVERFLSVGERVEQKAIMRVATIDPLRVEVFVPATQFNSIKNGSQVLVKPDLPGIAAQRARVTLVDRAIDPASNTFRVRLDLPNPDGVLPSGTRCKVDFTALADKTAAPSLAPANTATAKKPGAAIDSNRPAAGTKKIASEQGQAGMH